MISGRFSISTSASGEEQRARLVHCCLPFDLLFTVRVHSLESLSDRVSSSTGDRVHFPFNFEAFKFLGSREQVPLLSGSAMTFSVGHHTRSNLQDITSMSRIEGNSK